jgi:glycosyltransferase involved in cell wall biosynthesis
VLNTLRTEVRDLSLPRVTFGIIVFNGEPFTRYCLRALYPFAHEIIVVEGACIAAAGVATPDGHSSDGTLERLHKFQAEEDPENKVQIVTRDGFWTEKDQMSQAYSQRATGDYLWQVDIDEFYQPEDMRTVLEMVRADPLITAVSFEQFTFWGGFDYVVHSWYLRRYVRFFHRLFKWGPGYQYVTHRPPTVLDPEGHDLRRLRWIQGNLLARRNIYLYHYCLLFPKQVVEKCEYYGNAPWAKREKAQQWAREVFMNLENPYRVHNVYYYPSWLERFSGDHPPQINALRNHIKAGDTSIVMRATDDIERLLISPSYRLGRTALKMFEPWARLGKGLWLFGVNLTRRLLDKHAGTIAAKLKKTGRAPEQQ